MSEEVESSKSVTVHCPACSAANELDQRRQIGCEKCQKPITGHKYKVKGIVPATLAFAVGIAGYGTIDRNFLRSERYPMDLEYALVNACTNGDLNVLPRGLYESKQEICLCAVEKTVEMMPYSELKERESEFRDVFTGSVAECY